MMEGPNTPFAPALAELIIDRPVIATALSYPCAQPLYRNRVFFAKPANLSFLDARVAKPLAVAYTEQSAVGGRERREARVVSGLSAKTI